VTRLWERLCVGSIRDAEALGVSNPHKITAVITLCEEQVRSRNQSINYLRFPINDNRPIPARQFDAVIDAVAESIRWGTALIHCLGGTSRTPILTAAWMHVVGYKNVEDALIEISEHRPIEPSPILLKSVMELL
jgi:protein-tyrosine phosphatase